MTYVATGIVRDYNASADTATVELTGIGIIDTWLDGVAVDQALDRSTLANGSKVTVMLPDPHRICEATIMALPVLPTSSAATSKTEKGRATVATNNSGQGSGTLLFPSAFATQPTVKVACDYGAIAISAGTVTTTGFGFTISGAPPNAVVYFTWTAVGT